MGTLNYLGIFNMAIKSALVKKKKRNKLTKTLGRCSVGNVWCLGFDIKTNNSQNSCGSLGAWIKESCQFFVWLASTSTELTCPKAYPGLPFCNQPFCSCFISISPLPPALALILSDPLSISATLAEPLLPNSIISLFFFQMPLPTTFMSFSIYT